MVTEVQDDARVRCAVCAEPAGYASSEAFKGWAHGYLLTGGRLRVPTDEAIQRFMGRAPKECHRVVKSLKVTAGTYDGMDISHTDKRALLNSAKAIDAALTVYFSDQTGEGETWLDCRRRLEKRVP
jgi:hypothetical protein